MSVVFTNGCFDILHRGHVLLLKHCREKYPAARVVVGINSDESVRRLKGESRPINCQEDRKLLLESIKYVDEVFVFDEDTPYNLIVKINPNVIVKGGDYSASEVVGNDICHVEIFNYVEGYSTTKTLQDISIR
jgi:D-beta-D-heptose 7-phosphate kinase/D-beta-D-heptose 1-phosphate adenosyltransferase